MTSKILEKSGSRNLNFRKIGLLLIMLFGLLKVDALITHYTFAYPDRGQFIEVDDLKIFYRQVGEGPDLVFLHGIGAAQNIWAKIEKDLAKDYRLTLLDLPGFGRSTKDVRQKYDLDSQVARVIEVIDKLDIKKAGLIGSSMGAALALWMNVHSPERFEKVVAIGPATDPKLVFFPFYKFSWLAKGLYFFTSRLSMTVSFQRVFNNYENFEFDRMNYSIKNQEPGPSSLEVFFLSTELLADKRMPKAFSKVKAEVLILGGKKDSMVPVSTMKELNTIIKGSSLKLHQSGGHHLMEDDPQWVTKNILEFLK